ncbi:MAG: murein biosynthesis integral membrane protein MurJ [Dermatophilaceae bacterium]
MSRSRATGIHTLAVAAGIATSRVVGLVRERAISHFLGLGPAADAFTFATRVPGLFQRLLGDGALSAALIPAYSRLRSEGRDEEAGRLLGATAGLLLALSTAFALLGIIAAEPLTAILGPGLDRTSGLYELTVDLVAIMFPVASFSVLSGWCLAVLNSHGRFFTAYVTPALVSTVQIAALVTAGVGIIGSAWPPTRGIDAGGLVVWLGIGTVIGGVLQVIVQLPFVWRAVGPVRLTLSTMDRSVRQVLKALAPVAAARGVIHLSTYVSLALATLLATGALASMRYAQVLYLLPVSLFGISVAAAELPRMSRVSAEEPAADRLETGLRRIAFFVVPTAIGYLVIGDLVVATLFGSGAFGPSAVTAVWIVLVAYTVGLLPSASSRLLQVDLYARGDTRTPARLAAARVAITLVAGAALMVQGDQFVVVGEGVRLAGELPAFRLGEPEVAEGPRLGAAGLALGASVGAWAENWLLARAIRRRGVTVQLGGGKMRTILLAALGAAALAFAVRPVAEATPWGLGGIVAVMLLAAGYLALANALGLQEPAQLLRRLTRRLPRS